MSDLLVLRDLGLILLAGAIVVLIARQLKTPSIVAYIIAGLLLGPALGLIGHSDSIDLIAEVGIALLLFLVGLELSFDKFRNVGRVAIVAGLGQVVVTVGGGFLLVRLFGFSVMESLFIAFALTISSTVVVVKLLGQKGELDTLYGRIAIGIFLVQDVVVIIALTFLTGFGSLDDVSLTSLAGGLGRAFGGMLLLLGIALLAARYLLGPVFGWIAGSADALFICSLWWCFLFVTVAELLHLSPEIGAFLAGISLAQLPLSHDLRRRVEPLMNFFVAVFFVSLGIQMQVGGALQYLVPALVLSVFVLVGKPIIFMWIISKMGYGERSAFLTSVTVAQVSEFSFVLAALGLSAGIISDEVMSLIAVIGVLTIASSAYMILYNHQLYDLMRRWKALRVFRARDDADDEVPDDDLSGHVIVVGINSLGRRIVRGMLARGEQVLAIDTSPGNLEGLECHAKLGNAEYLSVLEEAGLARAKLLVSALQIEESNTILAYWGRTFGVPTSIHAFDQSLVDELTEAGATHLIVSKSSGTRRIADAFRKAGVFE